MSVSVVHLGSITSIVCKRLCSDSRKSTLISSFSYVWFGQIPSHANNTYFILFRNDCTNDLGLIHEKNPNSFMSLKKSKVWVIM